MKGRLHLKYPCSMLKQGEIDGVLAFLRSDPSLVNRGCYLYHKGGHRWPRIRFTDALLDEPKRSDVL